MSASGFIIHHPIIIYDIFLFFNIFFFFSSNFNFEKCPGEYKKQDRTPTSDAGSLAIVGANLVFARPGNAKIRITVDRGVKFDFS